MKSLKHFLYLAAVLFASVAISACTPEEPEGPVDEGKVPSVKLVADTVTATTITFTITPAYAEQVRYAYYEKTVDFTAPSYTDLLAQGVEISTTEATTITVENLITDQTYVVMVAAKGNEMTIGQTVEMTPVTEPVEIPVLPDELEVTFESAEYDGAWIDYMMQYIYFTNEDYTFTLQIDNADPISAGIYTPSMMGESGTFSNFSYIQSNADPSLYGTIVDGTITVEINGDNYKFTFDLVLGNESQDGIIMNGTYEGPVIGIGDDDGSEDNPVDDPNAPDFPELPDGEADSEFFTVAWVRTASSTSTTICFATTYGTRQFIMPIFQYEGYEGTYIVGWENKQGEIDYSNASYITPDVEGWPNPGDPESMSNTVTMTKMDGNWKVEFNLTSMSNTDPIVGIYEGPINGLDAGGTGNGPDEPVFPFTKAWKDGVFTDEYGMELTELYFASEDERYLLYMPIRAYEGYEGTYIVSTSYEPGDLDFMTNYYVSPNAVDAYLNPSDNGYVTITKAGDNWKVEFNLTSISGSTDILVGTYEGPIEGLSAGSEDDSENPGSTSFTQAYYDGLNEKGAVIIVFSSESGDDFVMPIFAYEGYEGTYFVGWEEKVGEIDFYSASYGSGWPNPGDPESDINTVTITKAGDIWRVDFNLTSMSNADPIVGTYEGPITDLP